MAFFLLIYGCTLGQERGFDDPLIPPMLGAAVVLGVQEAGTGVRSGWTGWWPSRSGWRSRCSGGPCRRRGATS
ncbi:hypothetical protein QCN29_20680 [Streptomyces sp. HNM0663]|uniref:Uncharacterized protein n=1 Tax=Streptomyces chengmaiensis TaxID=3040919 RepID=A0ABT6HR10_9ACTN|nr:hypothetical protein [Streptomyces chengmaiensis]MDH2391162.1 hypothetical protein [Streptomyces chengmaiensis]